MNKRLRPFSEIIPIQEQKESIEHEISNLKLKLENETNSLIEKREKTIREKEAHLTQISQTVDESESKILNYKKEISALEAIQNDLIEKQEFIECSFYSPKYNLMSSEKYKERLDQIKEKQKILIQNKSAISCHVNWRVGGSLKEGEKLTNQNIKLGLSSYNGQVDNIILTVSYKNCKILTKTYQLNITQNLPV